MKQQKEKNGLDLERQTKMEQKGFELDENGK